MRNMAATGTQHRRLFWMKPMSMFTLAVMARRLLAVRTPASFGRTRTRSSIINGAPEVRPVLFGNKLIFNCDGMDLRYVIALDKLTGTQIWKTDRSVETKDDGFFRKAFSTPLVASLNDAEILLTAGANQVSALKASNGMEVWNASFFGYAGVTVPIAAEWSCICHQWLWRRNSYGNPTGRFKKAQIG